MYRLLLVDDEVKSREALSLYFPWHEISFEVAGQANDGREALRIMEREHVDVVLTDIKMPVMSGIDLAEAIYRTRKEVIVIFISAYRDFEYAQKAMDYRVKNYIVKPAKYEVLIDVFSKVRQELEQAAAANGASSPQSVTGSQDGYIISKVKWYVRQQYRTATLEEAANIVHLNANYLSQLFKQKTEMNFVDYLIQVKMQVAQQLLRDPRYKTYEVSELVGYSNAKNFTRAFKQFCGLTPSEYRNGSDCREEQVLH